MSDCKNAEKAAVIGLFSLHRNGRAGRQGTGNDKGIPCRSGIPLSEPGWHLLFFLGLCYAFAHLRIGLYVLESVIVHDAEVPAPERFGYRKRYFRFGEYYFGPRFLCFGLVLLLMRYCHGAFLLRFGLCDVLVCIGLVNLKFGADVLPYVDIRYVDGENLECRSRIQAFFEHYAGDVIGIFEYDRMRFGGAYRRDDSLSTRRAPSPRRPLRQAA